MQPSVAEFYTGKNILITGSTGFVGKVLVEKLLRSCGGINKIYLLLRQKKGVSSEDRLKELCNNKCFENLRTKQPEVFNKLKLVPGDILEDELGLSNDDRQELQKNCNIIFHSAACVRFDQKLKDEVNLNTTGTLRVLELAKTIENLEAFVHLSTAYCRCELPVLEEKLYPAMHSPRRVMDIVQWMDDDMLNYLEPKLIASEPNTYSYTKAITENLVAEYQNEFPIAIGRPSIVTCSWKEPMPGWVDNKNGPTGILIGSGKGVIRTMHCEASYHADAIPVDVVANGCILIAYATAIDRAKEMRIYNITLSGIKKITWGQIIEIGKKWIIIYPYTLALWYVGGTIKSYWLTHQFCLIFTHLLPAYFVDALLFLLGKKTFMVNVQKRISHGLSVLQYYTTKEWHFKNTNFLSLQKRISKEENDVFYTDVSALDEEEYLKDYVLGARHYVLKEDPNNMPRARKLNNIRYVVDMITKIILVGLFLWFLYSRIPAMTSYVASIDNSLRNWLNGDKSYASIE
ncbi:putative fatty acyl-CoA reductase CG5065 [Papilio machaon]|uniref:putative fatty acyl-CoA reductase CG5065 n=1 Tax=Papilio machaon TaxID=76193 RepID=UPI001E663CCB|nr:putative fatty acyl-CoA reductase CG5065 [Papilio machaon]XP_014371688.2 putative fatty acyl-CoA reductase CG5065 [Papilio machaon]XP_014371690.2 putative fatty acyl-CoA reductase CG5065 [Papilio machaon]